MKIADYVKPEIPVKGNDSMYSVIEKQHTSCQGKKARIIEKA